jgi:hypothetical protein
VPWIGRVDNYFKGCIDEVSISTVARSADWIATEYRNIQNTGPFYSISDISSFPVEWLGLEAVRTAHAVQLQWITATETGSDYFTVERSADGSVFTDLSRTDAAGYSESPRTYTATDAAPLAGTTWYRIRETDLDGTTSWSSIVEVGPAGFLSAVSVYPNPAVDRLTVQWPAQAGQTKPVVATLYNSLGAQVPLTLLSASATRLDVAVGHLAEGLYFLDLQQAGSSYRIPVVIRP